MRKQVFSAALAGCMMLTMVPVTAFAAEEGVAVSREAATEMPSFELLKADARNQFVGGKEARDFVDLDGTVKLVKGYQAFNESVAADRAGYYLPLVLHIPGATTNTDIILKESESRVQADGSIVKVDKKLDGETAGLFDVLNAEEGQINIVKQIARMDGELLGDKKLTAEIWLDGENGAADPIIVEYDYSDAKLEDAAKYKNAELKLYTSNAELLYGKRVREIYDVSSQTVKLVTDYDGFAGETSGYYLPLQLEFDAGCEDAVVKVKTGKDKNGKDIVEDVRVASGSLAEGKIIFVQRIAGVDGKKLQDKLEVTVYPQGTGKGMPSKTCTYDLADVKLVEGLAIGVVPVKKDAVDTKDQASNLAIKNNLDQVQSVVLKDGVLTVKANVNSAVSYGTGKDIPVLFTMTVGGESAVAADKTVANYGGVSGTHVLQWVDLTQAEARLNLPAPAGLNGEVKVKVVDITGLPALKDSAAVTVEEAGSLTVLEGLNAQKEAAATAAELKGMFDAKKGSIVVTNAVGVELAADDAVRTGTMVVLKDKDGKIVETITVIVKGDVTGSATANAGQIVAVGKAVLGTQSLTGAYALAGDVNGSGKIDAGDLVAVGQMVLNAK